MTTHVTVIHEIILPRDCTAFSLCKNTLEHAVPRNSVSHWLGDAELYSVAARCQILCYVLEIKWWANPDLGGACILVEVVNK